MLFIYQMISVVEMVTQSLEQSVLRILLDYPLVKLLYQLGFDPATFQS